MNNQKATLVAVKKNLSPVLERLMDEVKNNNQNTVNGSYDRTHNRHNRGQ
ncbi:YhhA family cyclophane-containing RiPP [Pantoea ananatis]|jgi:hypothetical protein|nr:YhhA family cyclophane-containing RiPP [Pantoea ananatis]